VRPLALALALAFVAGACAGPQQNARPEPPASPIPVGESPTEGPADAPVTIVEFSDFQCPYCAKVQPTLRELADLYPSQLRFVFKNNPLGFHREARQAALAALAAARQGKWAPYRSALFANQRSLSTDDLMFHAKRAGLDLERFERDLRDPLLAAQVDADQALAASLGATGTPTFFINGRLLTGAKPLLAFRELIDEELRRSEALRAFGMPSGQMAEALTWLNRQAPPVDAALRKEPRPTRQDPALTRVEVGPESPRRGPDDAPVTMVVFIDYQCPYCARLDKSLDELSRRFEGQLRIVVRQLPLAMHKDARLAAEAALAAADQGRFWPYHALLLANQRALGRADLVRMAREVGLDVVRFEAALSEGRFARLVEQDEAAAAEHGASGTPTSFINGRIVRGAVGMERLVGVVEAELERALEVSKREGLHGEALYRRLVERE
jgi:protein-disulfide isomerase